jgi:hypothetical protein
MKRTRAVLAASLMTASLAACGLFSGKHEVGECVRTRVSLGGTDITTADCPQSGSSPIDNISDPIYRISAVLGYDEHCSDGRSIGVELKHEPDDAVYCLDLAYG